MIGQTEVVFRGKLSPAYRVMGVVTLAKNALAARRITNAPLPGMLDYVGCELLITERRAKDGRNIGRLVLSQQNGKTRFEREWTIVVAPP
jgi:hypothetical protein